MPDGVSGPVLRVRDREATLEAQLAPSVRAVGGAELGLEAALVTALEAIVVALAGLRAAVRHRRVTDRGGAGQAVFCDGRHGVVALSYRRGVEMAGGARRAIRVPARRDP